MRRFFTWLRWTLIAGALLLLLAIAGVLIYTQTDSFRRLVEEKALAAINQSINGVVTWDRLEGSLLGNLRVYDLRVRYRERDVFRAARAEVGYSLLPLLWARVQITKLEAGNPWVELRKDPDGDWTIVEALSSGEPSTEPSQWVFAIDGIVIDDGELIFEPEASKPEVYRVRRLNLNGSVQIANGLDAQVDRLGAWIEAKGIPQIYAQGALNYRQTPDTESVALEKFWLQTAHSKVMLAGTVRDFATLNTDLKVNISELAAADLNRFVPGWPANITVRGEAHVGGTGKALENEFKLFLAGAQVSGALRADVLSETKPYSGNIAVRSLEVSKVLPGKDFAGVVSADVKISGSASDFDSINGAGTMSVKSAVANRIALGMIEVEGTFNPKVADFTGALRGPVGAASWRSRVELGAQPQYRVELEVPSLKADQIVQLDSSSPAELSFKGIVEGTGFDLKTMNTRANIDLLQSRLGEVTIENGKILARVFQGRIRFQQVQLQATGATLAAQGELGVELERPGQLDYRLQVSNLTPWLELVQREGSGRLELTGSASGNLARLQTHGAMILRTVNLPELEVQSGRVDFNLERKSGATLPAGDVKLDLSGVRAGVRLAKLQATIKLPPAGGQAIAVSASARDQDGRAHRLLADVEYQPQALVVRARELMLTLPDGTWRLAEPVRVTRVDDDYRIDRLILRNQSQLLSVSGRFALSGSQELDATIERLSLATLYSYYTKAPDITGTLSARAQIRGTAAAPAIAATAELMDSKIAGQSYQGMRAAARYQNQSIALDATVEQDKAHSLQVRGAIPLALGWEDGNWRAQPLPGLNLRARSDGLSLAFLNALKLEGVQNISGEVALDMALLGTLTAPEPRGTFQLRNGALEAKPLGLKLSGILAAGSADAQRISLSRLSARSGDGTLAGSGVLSLRQFTPEKIDVTLTARRWPAIQTAQYRAIINGNLRVDGHASAPRIGGAIEVVEGNIRPALGFLDRSSVSLTRDPTIIVVKQRGGKPLAPDSSKKTAAADNDLLERLVLEVAVTIPNNFWIRHANANVELSGKLSVVKKPESDLTVTGLLEVVRGWVGFQGRRFTLTRGIIRFNGTKPADATLDFVTEYRVNGYLVNATVKGTVEKPDLVLASQPQLEQSDILSLLLFNKPVAELNSGEQVSLQQNAIDLGAGFAAATLGKAVSEALGLQSLGFDLSDVSFTGGQLRFGRYIGPRTYVAVSQEVSGELEREVTVEYQIMQNWRVGATTSTNGNSGADIIWHKRY